MVPAGAPREAVVLFDGDCGLCARWIRFVARVDRGYFRFAPLDGLTARRLLGASPPGAPRPDTVVLVEDGRAYTRSTAALRIAARLSRPWGWLSFLLVLPAPLRDWAYDVVARNRSRWFGPASACGVPPANLRDRLLD